MLCNDHVILESRKRSENNFVVLNCFSITFAGSPDILICGNCREMFSDLVDMMEHKRDYCKLRFTCKCDALNEENDGSSPCTDCTSNSPLPSSASSSTVASNTVTNHGNNTNNWNFLPLTSSLGGKGEEKCTEKNGYRIVHRPHLSFFFPTNSHATFSNRNTLSEY